jgi:tetratricopeptide (TPR) repeat protein
VNNKLVYIILIILIISSFIAYGRILGNGFVSFDDHQYIIENNHIKSGINAESIKWAFSAVVSKNWHPLTWVSHMLDWSLFKDNAGGHHFISLLFHIGTALLLFLFLNRTTKSLWLSAFAAAFFALHPLRVESVAWAAERKDVLSMFFGMSVLYAYAVYVEKHQFYQYLLCLILFALSLMAKSMLVTLPFVLLLLDYWPLGRWPKEIITPPQRRSFLIGSLLWEKVPFLCLAIGSSIVTFWVQNKGGAVVSIGNLSFFARITNAVVSYISYLRKIISPIDLAVFYPYEHLFPLWQVTTSFFILIGITIVVLYAMKKFPFLFVGWFWYLGTLVPVIGLVQVGKQAMADRYTYLPSIGITIMLVWGISLFFQREEMRKKILFPAGITYLAIMAILTWEQCGYWKNSVELFNHALHVTKNNYLAYNARGITYGEMGQYQMVIEDFNKAVGFKQDYMEAYFNRGFAYVKLGQYRLAVDDFNEAIRLKPDEERTRRLLKSAQEMELQKEH